MQREPPRNRPLGDTIEAMTTTRSGNDICASSCDFYFYNEALGRGCGFNRAAEYPVSLGLQPPEVRYPFFVTLYLIAYRVCEGRVHAPPISLSTALQRSHTVG